MGQCRVFILVSAICSHLLLFQFCSWARPECPICPRNLESLASRWPFHSNHKEELTRRVFDQVFDRSCPCGPKFRHTIKALIESESTSLILAFPIVIEIVPSHCFASAVWTRPFFRSWALRYFIDLSTLCHYIAPFQVRPHLEHIQRWRSPDIALLIPFLATFWDPQSGHEIKTNPSLPPLRTWVLKIFLWTDRASKNNHNRAGSHSGSKWQMLLLARNDAPFCNCFLA